MKIETLLGGFFLFALLLQTTQANRQRPKPCCLPNGLTVKDTLEMTTRDASRIIDSYELTSYTMYKDGAFVEIRLSDTPDSAQVWLLEAKSTSRSLIDLQFVNEAWCKKSETVEYIGNITAFDIFRSGCSDEDASKFSGWDESGNEKYSIRTVTEETSETMILSLERVSRSQCKPARFEYIFKTKNTEGSEETTIGKSTFTKPDRNDVRLIESLLLANSCAE